MKSLFFVALVLLVGCAASQGTRPATMSAQDETRYRAICEQRARAAYAHPNWSVEAPNTAALFARNRCLTEFCFVGVR